MLLQIIKKIDNYLDKSFNQLINFRLKQFALKIEIN
jgi:hypothetical protein